MDYTLKNPYGSLRRFAVLNDRFSNKREVTYMNKKNHSKKRQADRSFRSGQPYHSSANDQAEFEAARKEAIRKAEMLRKAMANGDPIAQPKNFVDGIQAGHDGSFFMVRQGVFRDHAGNCALDVHVYAYWPDPLGVCIGKPFIGREVKHISSENADAWLHQSITIPQRMMAAGITNILGGTKTLSISPRRESAGEQFITGREFDHVGTVCSQECLYQDKKSRRFSLEITLTAKEPDELGLQGSDPYILRVAVPLSEAKADLWVRQTGAPDVAPEMFVRIFRSLFTGLDACGEFTLPVWRFSH